LWFRLFDTQVLARELSQLKSTKFVSGNRLFIERLFRRLKENKMIAMRFDKLDSTFLSFIARALSNVYKLFC